MSLRRLFENEVSSSAFQVIDGELRIIGKFAQISILDNGLFDIWLVAPGLEPLSTRKLNSIMKMFPQEAKFTVLTGEAPRIFRGGDGVDAECRCRGRVWLRNAAERRGAAAVHR